MSVRGRMMPTLWFQMSPDSQHAHLLATYVSSRKHSELYVTSGGE